MALEAARNLDVVLFDKTGIVDERRARRHRYLDNVVAIKKKTSCTLQLV